MTDAATLDRILKAIEDGKHILVEGECLLDIEEAAAQLKCTPKHVRYKLGTRAWAGVKMAGRWMMTPAQVQQAIELSSTTAAEPEPPRPSGLVPRSRTFKRRTTS